MSPGTRSGKDVYIDYQLSARSAYGMAVLSLTTGAATEGYSWPSRTCTARMGRVTSEQLRANEERLRSFAKAIDRIRSETESRIGAEDVAYIKRVRRVSRASEVVGRTLIHFSLDPVTFGAGVLSLWLHKQLEATEIGHTALHGAFDQLEGAEEFHSKSFRWDTPIDEQAWHRGHNIAHHQYPNIADRDPDVCFGPVRLTEHAPVQSARFPLLDTAITWLTFSAKMNLHFTGLDRVYLGCDPADDIMLKDRSRSSIFQAHREALRKYIPYYAYNFVLFPALAGPMAGKVLVGNITAELIRDLYSAATIYCGHVGPDVESFPAGTKARSRGEFYVMQVEASQNFEVPLSISILCGALDRQIEHHLFPRFPTNRLREVAADVRKACEEHGVQYNTGSWGKVLKSAFQHLRDLGPNGKTTQARERAQSESFPAAARA
jgi:fatty acid desaturase